MTPTELEFDRLEARRVVARKQLSDFYHWYANNQTDIIYVSLMSDIRKAEEPELERLISEMEERNSRALMKKLSENVV